MHRGRDLRHMRRRLVSRRIGGMLKMILYLHIAGGSAALLSMFIPLATRKGGRTHRRSGWVFVAGMTLVSITALALCGARYFFDPRPEAKAFALFLFYIAILAGNAVSVGVRVLRTKERTGPHTHPWDVGMTSLLTLTSIVMGVYGIATSRALFAGFSVIGLVSGVQGLYYWLRTPSGRMHWWFRHMSAMLGACIAATTAFLVVNAPQAGFSRTSLIVWFTPGIVGTIATAIWTRYYRRRFGTRPAPPAMPNAQRPMLNAQQIPMSNS
ncbi:MAG TPA: hypothetical protein VN654_04085 [Vicinamibacterales bacterium]|nr:hypothetical protein [Vicinamibacterales bacterium]